LKKLHTLKRLLALSLKEIKIYLFGRN